ncbi:Type IV secretory pathway ATPase VirB11/Archaellum biosynthesis ATPase [Natronoarchaeum philippinense]|uniref:Type IV secretory pathway ATPase VirB11/Archaellum biosynthesis ATPase n=1 Tax=Natronoarchaeum philippinense TaxID=558529 RepID=A0A285NVB8_NATPI|nr:ATPase, T2SS/T4P/T4SS family [Natronoarchaeum philippinense]SNZ12967.1 Type IV secretory pathway ATPase VirB11/Archaellum biosynthesis ATPase [Natronoarchaeum philippinense]
MRKLLDRIRGGGDDGYCGCRPAFDGETLRVDAGDCAGAGKLAESEKCRATVVDALTERDAERVVTRTDGVERAYEDRAAALLVAAGRFAERIAFRDERLAERARRDPLRASRDADARGSQISGVAAETGLAAVAESAASYETALRPYVGPTVAGARVAARPPADGRLLDTRSLDTGSDARIYERPGAGRTYHLLPASWRLDADARATLAAAYRLLAAGGVDGEDRAPGRAVRRVADEGTPVTELTEILEKHTRGFGAVSDLLSDPAVSDVFATAPVDDNPVRVLFDGDRLPTNVRLTEQDAAALASRFRRASGRAFSRASPTLAASAEIGDDRTVRVAGVTDPVSDGDAFVFRDQGDEPLTIPALVANGTLPPDAAALLSVAVERSCAGLIAGTRGAGKTTLLGALLWELSPATRTVVIEDTPELPVGALLDTDRDVQQLTTAVDADDGPGITPTAALRTALRLGEGALVLGEVRGEEAQVLYEAMRVGASGSAVLGTIHGDGGASVRERVVADLDVPESSFAVTDLVVTVAAYEGPEGRARRVERVEEVLDREDGVAFASLFELHDGILEPTGRIGRGESRLLDRLRRSGESYADIRKLLSDREAELERLVTESRTRPADVATAYGVRRRDERDALRENEHSDRAEVDGEAGK